MVTGASRGIGRAIALRFARDGDDVIGVGRDLEALEDLAGESAHISVAGCDVTDERAVKALFAAHDDVEVLVCNAGAAAAAPLERTTLETWRSLLDANATSVFLALREAIPAMRRRGRGRIVVIASTAARAGAPTRPRTPRPSTPPSAWCASPRASSPARRSPPTRSARPSWTRR
jgi:2-hydroxycyclohexanecarboxyl-CoA dehydrogenase